MKYVPEPTSELTLEWVTRQLRQISDSIIRETEYRFIVPASLNVATGGTPVGDVTDLQVMLDGNEYQLPEVTGTPGFDLEINFSNVSRIRGIVTKCRYDGASPHYAEVRLHNYTTVADDILLRVDPAATNNTRTVLLPSDENYIDTDGSAQIVFYHPGAGNATHDLYIDYVAILS